MHMQIQYSYSLMSMWTVWHDGLFKIRISGISENCIRPTFFQLNWLFVGVPHFQANQPYRPCRTYRCMSCDVPNRSASQRCLDEIWEKMWYDKAAHWKSEPAVLESVQDIVIMTRCFSVQIGVYMRNNPRANWQTLTMFLLESARRPVQCRNLCRERNRLHSLPIWELFHCHGCCWFRDVPSVAWLRNPYLFCWCGWLIWQIQ